MALSNFQLARQRFALTPEEREQALELASQGVPGTALAVALGLTLRQWAACVGADPSLAKALDEMQRAHIEALATRLLVVHRWSDTSRAKLYSDNLKWLLERRIAAYRRTDVTEVKVQVDLRAAIALRREGMRVLEQQEPAPLLSSSEGEELASWLLGED
jgi:hypothetical protein